MKKNALVLLILIAIGLSGCGRLGIRGNGQITTDQRTIGEFYEIDVDGAFVIEWRSGPPMLSITTDSNLLSYIESGVSGNRLRLHTREKLWPTRSIKVAVSSQRLSGADLEGAVRLTAQQISGPKFYFKSEGASQVTLNGNVDELLVDMTGASKLDAQELQAKTVQLSGTGASKADVTVSETLRVSLTGAGKVTYSGKPKTIERHITGAGWVGPKEKD